MYTQVASKLALSAADQFSQAVSMEGANAAYVEFATAHREGARSIEAAATARDVGGNLKPAVRLRRTSEDLYDGLSVSMRPAAFGTRPIR